MAIAMPASLKLEEFGAHLYGLFGRPAYHVGSSLGPKTQVWRDVDVRMLLADEECTALFGQCGADLYNNPHCNPGWVAMTLAFSCLGKEMTGLPIDFQIQPVECANAQFSQKDGHHRSALGLTKLQYANEPRKLGTIFDRP